MPIDNKLMRTSVGIYNFCHYFSSCLRYNSLSLSVFYVFPVMCELSFVAHFMLLLLPRSGDIEKNPGPKKSSPVKFCHWNLNGLVVHDIVHVPLTEVFITTHNFDIICLSKKFLNSAILQIDENIKTNGHSTM